jgi:hypothetical protein
LIRLLYQRHFKSNARLAFIVGVGLLFVSSVFVGFLGDAVYRSQQLATEGLPATGTVVNKIVHRAGDRSTDGTFYEVEYLFTSAAGPRFMGHDTIEGAIRDQITEGGPVDIEYVAGQPRINQIGHATMPSFGAYLAVAFGAMLWPIGAALACNGLLTSWSARACSPGARKDVLHFTPDRVPAPRRLPREWFKHRARQHSRTGSFAMKSPNSLTEIGKGTSTGAVTPR